MATLTRLIPGQVKIDLNMTISNQCRPRLTSVLFPAEPEAQAGRARAPHDAMCGRRRHVQVRQAIRDALRKADEQLGRRQVEAAEAAHPLGEDPLLPFGRSQEPGSVHVDEPHSFSCNLNVLNPISSLGNRSRKLVPAFAPGSRRYARRHRSDGHASIHLLWSPQGCRSLDHSLRSLGKTKTHKLRLRRVF